MIKKLWWHDKIAYQVWPKSFCDSNGDGIGDLEGIISKLDYLKLLGIDIIWLSPVYKSPWIDEGYDISDYYAIDPRFGTMDQFCLLLAEAERRGMYIVMDLVVNHCSNQHEWFRKALADPDGPYADYFYFRKGKRPGALPSNYRSYFGGSAWEPVPGTDRFYLHFFAKEQPDLNWENPELRAEIYKMINWWLDKGVAGFRIDAIVNIKKDIDFPDYPADGPDGLVRCTTMVEHAEGLGNLLSDLRDHTFKSHHAFTVGEVFTVPRGRISEFIGDNGYFSTMFDFSAHTLSENGKHGWYDRKPVFFADWRRAVSDSQLCTQDFGFMANIIENHDEPRGASSWLPEWAGNVSGIQMLAVQSLLLRGIPFIFQGQELGMKNCSRCCIGKYDDICTKNEYEKALRAGVREKEALAVCFRYSRDNCRTPMPWNSAENAGFTSGKPWMALNPSYLNVNVADENRDPDSVLNFYRKLIALRKNPAYSEVLTWGKFHPVYKENEGIFAYYRYTEPKNILIICNFGMERKNLFLPDGRWKILLANNAVRNTGAVASYIDGRNFDLPSCGAVVMEKVN